MWEASFVVLREAAELIFIALSARAYLLRIDRADLLTPLARGVAGGALAASALVLMLSLTDCDDHVEAALSIGLGLSVLFMAIAMLSSRTAIDHHVRGRLEDYLDGPAGVSTVLAFGAFASFREFFEAGLFLQTITNDHGWMEAVGGIALGGMATGLMVLAYRSLQSRFSLYALFRLSTLVLSLIAIQLTLEGLGMLFSLYTKDTSDFLQTLATTLTPGSAAYGYICAALMAGPLYLVVRHWWRETGALPD